MWSGLPTPTTPHGNTDWDNLPNSYATASFNKARALSVNAQSAAATMYCDSTIDNSMVWHNPNPKKPAQPDRGTSIWGDPAVQGTIEIRRWKINSEDIVDAKTSTGMAAAAAAAPVPTPTVASSALQNGTTTTSSSTSSSVWSDSPVAPQPEQTQPTDLSLLNGWNNSPPSSLSPAADVFSPAALNSTGALTERSQSVVGSSNLSSSSGIASSTSNSIWASTPVKNNGSGLNWAANEDSSLSSGKLNGAGSNSSVFTFPSLAQLQPGSDKFVPNDQVASLTKKIGDQLKTAVNRGLIDLNVLQQQQLPEDALFKLNQLLQYVARMDQILAELQTLQQMGGQQPTSKQLQEYQRLNNERVQLESSIQTLRNQIGGANSAISPGALQVGQISNIGPGPGSGASVDSSSLSNGDVFNRSKLFLWKNGSTSHDNEKKLNGCSSPTNNVENFVEQNSAVSLGRPSLLNGGTPTAVASLSDDLWSNKRTSAGPDWPTNLTSKLKQNTPSYDLMSNNGFESALNGFPLSGFSGVPLDQDLQQEFRTGSGTGGNIITPNSSLNVGNHSNAGWGEFRDPNKFPFGPSAADPLISSASSNTPCNLPKPNNFIPGFNHQKMNADFNSSMSSFFDNNHQLQQHSSMFGNDFKNGAFDAPNMFNNRQQQRPSSQIGQMSGRVPIVKNAAANVQNAFNPLNFDGRMNQNMAAPQQPWIVLSNLNNEINDQVLRMIITQKVGTTTTFISPPLSGCALFKLRDVPYMKALQYLEKDLSHLGVKVSVMKDAEVEYFLQSLSGRNSVAPLQQPPPTISKFAANHHNTAPGGHVIGNNGFDAGCFGGLGTLGGAQSVAPYSSANQVQAPPIYFSAPFGAENVAAPNLPSDNNFASSLAVDHRRGY